MSGFKVLVLEKSNWGFKEDSMVLFSRKEAEDFIKWFNQTHQMAFESQKYIFAQNIITEIDLTVNQYLFLDKNGRTWYSLLKLIK